MENEIEVTDIISEENQKKPKILTNKAYNSLVNLISYLMNNKNYFEEKIKPSELDIKLTTNSDMSYINQLIYKIDINYLSFNPKRDTVNNINKYRQIPAEIELKDEYYESQNIFERIKLDFFPNIKKGIILDLSVFPFYSFDKKKLKAERFSFKQNENKNNNKDNNNNNTSYKFILCIYTIQTDEATINKIDKTVEELKNIKNIWDYCEKVYVIYQANTLEHIIRLAGNKKIKNYIFMDNLNPDNKIIYIFNPLSINNESKDNNNNLINIFSNRNTIKEKGKEYFFILNKKNNKIMLLKSITNLQEIVSYFLFYLKTDSTNDSFINKEKEKTKLMNLSKARELLNFVSKLKKLDYFFDMDFKISINISISDDLKEIEIKKINSIVMNGKFFKKEFDHLMGIYNLIRQKTCTFNASQIPTIDINIDFTDMTCHKCLNKIKEDTYLYYCYKCKNKYCYECVQKQLKNKGKGKYIDENHNIIFFKTRDKKNFMGIETSKIGQDKFAKHGNADLENKHNARCFGCKNNITDTERYICLKCRRGNLGDNTFVDYCGKCIDTMCKDQKEMIKLEEEANGILYNRNRNNFLSDHKIEVKHKHEEHIYIMLPLQIKQENYQKYNF